MLKLIQLSRKIVSLIVEKVILFLGSVFGISGWKKLHYTLDMFTKIKNWIHSIGKQDPNGLIPVSFDFNDEKSESVMTAREVDDLTEIWFGKRWFETVKSKDAKTKK